MEQSDLLRLVLDVLEGQQIVYCLGGSLASGVYGEPRYTHDIDVVVDLRMEQVARLCQAFPTPEFYVSQQAAREAVTLRSQFNVIHPGIGSEDRLPARPGRCLGPRPDGPSPPRGDRCRASGLHGRTRRRDLGQALVLYFTRPKVIRFQRSEN